MTREEAKQLLPIIQAFAEGEIIECRTKPGTISAGIPNEWTEIKEIGFWNGIEYRIKPEPKYRPFANAEECWKEMQKHQPFGWVKTIHDEDPEVFIHCEVITKIDGVLTSIDEVPFSYDNMYRTYTFADGTPFGILEEE